MKVLVIDDAAIDRELVANIVERHFGGKSVSVHSCDAALQALQKTAFDLVICDYFMPHGSGMDVFNFVQKQERKTPFILFTAGADNLPLQGEVSADLHIVDKHNVLKLKQLVAQLLPQHF